MHVKSRMPLEPFLDDRMLVSGVVIHDQMQLQAFGCFPVDLFQEGQPFLMPMLGFDAADQPTLQIIHGREQRKRAVANIVMGSRAEDMADTQWQVWLRALQRLNLALFIAAEHQRLIRRCEVQSDNVPEFFFEVRIIGELEGAGQVRLYVVGGPYTLDAGR